MITTRDVSGSPLTATSLASHERTVSSVGHSPAGACHDTCSLCAEATRDAPHEVSVGLVERIEVERWRSTVESSRARSLREHSSIAKSPVFDAVGSCWRLWQARCAHAQRLAGRDETLRL